MPITEFAGSALVQIRDGGSVDEHALPVSGGAIAIKPVRPEGPATRTLLDGTRRERRASGWYVDTTLEWPHLSTEGHAALVALVDALHARSDAAEVWLCPESPWDAQKEWRVVPHIDQDDIQIVYENRVQERPARLSFRAHDKVPTLPGWL